MNGNDKTAVKNDLSNCCVMVVDDDEDVCDLMALNLTRLGCDSIVFNNGRDAVEHYQHALLTNAKVDIVIVDLSLQDDMDGVGVKDAILALHSQAKIIVSSGHSFADEMLDFKQFGFVAALEKNFNRKKIEQVLQDVLLA